ncbi:response regulator [Leuconostoc rapi]|uniref:response regulator n=1 Tax=Leuconostoc rapi TaxID=1406906 RepID=UPI00195D74D2|nr:response regulator [Leuconostoc rapi]MBM7435871.1 CitB family two-component system response regulator MalR [Leuconostoc rapi]
MTYSVLIIEDDPMVAEIISQFLNQTAHALFAPVTIVGRLEEVQERVDLSTIDLLLIDVYLPDGKGTTFLTELRNKHISVATIMITAADDRETFRQAMTNGVIDYLIKPFQMQRFNQAIQKFLVLEEIALRKEKLSQRDVNQYFQGEAKIEPLAMDLPKGISELTLKLIIATIFSFSKTFSNQTLSQQVKLSRVTTKKYLDYLVENAFLTVKVTYLDVGRPLSCYKINPLKYEALRRLTI